MSVLISQIMSRRVVTVEMDDRLEVAKEIFDNVAFNHLLVVDDNNLLQGVLSQRDLAHALSPNLGTAAEYVRDTETLQKRIHQVMSHDPVTTGPNMDLKTASRLILQHGIGCLPVLENNQIVGIVTWKDLLRSFSCD
ncbi:CBS domain-containing protein [Shewanella sp. SR44-3]|uniref:CBS domain-containing protein n=1 Tax=Shewanella sp. SR44-3 TaxID=2760936 RepID=UPI0015FBD434|nr:CBS domain-containing protein [Shewanella sp. SR44-3]MBB1270542.1 CBS domain-containing protein [Shewanella sp. SR44-3]